MRTGLFRTELHDSRERQRIRGMYPLEHSLRNATRLGDPLTVFRDPLSAPSSACGTPCALVPNSSVSSNAFVLLVSPIVSPPGITQRQAAYGRRLQGGGGGVR